MQYTDIIFFILSIIAIILGVWLVIALIPSTMVNIEEIRRRINILTLNKKINRIYELQQTNEYLEMTDENKKQIDMILQSIESSLDSMEKVPISQYDVELSLSIQSTISAMVDRNVDSFVHNNYAINNERYNIMQLDVDVKKISTYVFSSLNPDIFKLNLIYTEKYLMTYIVEYTKTKLLSVVIPYNRDFAE